jgi:ABC-type antimicrobial peptide transport system permease subunit
VRNSKVYRLSERPEPYFYVPIRQVYRPEYGYTFLVRTRMPADQAALSVAQAVKAADPNIPVFNAMPLATYIGAPLARERTAAFLLALLAGVALLLAAIGLYGVMAHVVAQQTKEIGVRVALGARRADVLRTIASRVSTLVVAGLTVGLAGGFMVSRLVSSLLYSVNPANLAIFGGAAAGMLLIAVIASSVPAWRGMKIDPIVALRAD